MLRIASEWSSGKQKKKKKFYEEISSEVSIRKDKPKVE